MPAEDIGSMQVEYAIETRQALSHLNDMGRYLEMVAAAAEYNAEAIDQMADSVGHDLEKATSKYEKYAAATEDYLKKVKHGWLIVTAAAVGMIYGLVRASSYGSIYMKQFGAATRMLADKIMEDSGLNDTIQTLADNFMDFSDKISEEGWFDAIISEIEDFIRWFDDLDWKMQAVLITVGLLAAAFTVLAAALLAVKVGAFITVGWLALGKILTWVGGGAVIGKVVLGIKAIIAAIGVILASTTFWIIALAALAAALIYLWSKTESGQKVIADLTAAWDKFWVTVSDLGYIEAIKDAIGAFLTWIVDNFGLIIREGSPLGRFFTWFQEKFNALIHDMLIWGKDMINELIIGIKSRFPNLTSVATDIYTTIWNKIWALIEPAYSWGSDILSNFINGIKSWLASLSATATDIYDTVATAVWDLISGAWGWGANIVSNLVDGIKGIMPAYETTIAKIPETAKTELQRTVNIADTKSIEIMDSFGSMNINLLDDFQHTFDYWADLLANMNTEITVDFEANWTNHWNNGGAWGNGGYDAASWSIGWAAGGTWSNGGGGWANDTWNNGGSWGNGGYDASSWSIGWTAGAIGGHVARSGTATIHEGEDIVRLKQLLSGLKTDQAQPASVVIAPTVHVHVDSQRGKDARRIGSAVSDEIAKEVRRIMPIR